MIVMRCAIFALLFVFTLSIVRAQADPTPPHKRIVLTRIDATKAAGLCLRVTANGLELTDLGGSPATTFTAAVATLSAKPTVKVNFITVNKKRRYKSASQTWKLTDSTGGGVEIVDNTLRSLIVVSKVDQTIILRNGIESYPVLGHSFLLLNDPLPNAVLDYGATGWLGFTGHYKEKMTPILRPTEVVISPNDTGITNGFPSISEDTLCSEQVEFRSH